VNIKQQVQYRPDATPMTVQLFQSRIESASPALIQIKAMSIGAY
jgi:hypothetical protein